jgi:biopolymer transport protein ExbB/TolQ
MVMKFVPKGVRMNRNSILLFITMIFLSLTAAPKQEVDMRQHEIAGLKNHLALQRDSLHREIAARWEARRKAVEQREVDKEEIARLSDVQEKVFNAAVAEKEKGYALERRIEEVGKTLDDTRQQWSYVQSVMTDLLDKESDAPGGFFPTDYDSARVRLEEINRSFRKRAGVTSAVRKLARYSASTLADQCQLTTEKATVLPDGEEQVPMTVARFGSVFGYGICEDGRLYTIAQSGREGNDRYRIRPIKNPVLVQYLTARFETWVADGAPSGPVMMDIMQNDQSGVLLSGKKESRSERLRQFIRAGGPVMIPLGILPLWALVIIIIKLIQFSGRQFSVKHIFRRLTRYLDNDDIGGARSFLQKKKGSAIRTAQPCLHPATTSRKVAESAVKEVLYTESSRLGRHLNTLAVIAGVAPLMGLLGTVTGMIRLFEVITRFGTGDPKLLAGGISEALITTEIGLIIAVPVLLIHNFLRNCKNGITAQLQIGALQLMNRLFPEKGK